MMFQISALNNVQFILGANLFVTRHPDADFTKKYI